MAPPRKYQDERQKKAAAAAAKRESRRLKKEREAAAAQQLTVSLTQLFTPIQAFLPLGQQQSVAPSYAEPSNRHYPAAHDQQYPLPPLDSNPAFLPPHDEVARDGTTCDETSMRGIFRTAQELENRTLAPPSPTLSQLSVSMVLSDGPDPEPTSAPPHPDERPHIEPSPLTVTPPSPSTVTPPPPATVTPPPQPSLTQEALAARIAKSLHSYNPIDLLNDESDSEIRPDASAQSEDEETFSLQGFLDAVPLMSEKPIPDVISHDKIAPFDRNSEYFNLHTAGERRALYSGLQTDMDEPSERIKIDATLDSEPCPTACQYFDRDSFIAFATSLAVAAKGLNIYTQQGLLSNMTSGLHLPTRSIPICHGNDDGDEVTGASRSRKVRVDLIPNACLGRFIGDDAVTVNIFFPHLFDVAKHHDEFHQGHGRKLTDAQYNKFMDQIFLPALYEGCSAAVSQEYPGSGRHAQLNSQAKYSELRSKKTEMVPRQQALVHPVSANRLSQIQRTINERAARPGNHEFRDSFLIIQAKGLKLDEVKSDCWSTMTERLREWRQRIFNTRYLSEETTFVDIAQTIVPDHTSIFGLPDCLHRPGQSLFWREDYLRRFFSWLDSGSSDGQKKAPTFWPVALLKYIAGATNEYSSSTDLHQYGLLYVQFYSSFKNLLAAADTYAFQNKDIPNLGIGASQMEQLQRMAGTVSVDVKCLIQAYLYCKVRCHEALTACLEKSYGLRQEYRVSWKLFKLIDAEMRRLATTAVISSRSPSQFGWIALPTQRIGAWYRWNLNKFCFGFEMLRSFSPDASIPWDHSRIMLLFLMCLSAFLGGEHPHTMPRLWLEYLPAKANRDSRERGLGMGINLVRDGYGWLDPVIDYHTMTFRPEYTHYIGFNTLPIFGNFKKRYHSAAGFWQDMIVVRSAEQWLQQYSGHHLKIQMIAELLRQICLRAFRRDVYATIKKDVTKKLRPQALRGNYPLTEFTLETVFHPEAANITFAIAKNQTIREYSQLFQILWGNSDRFQRGAWAAHAGYRALYQMCHEALTRHISRQYAALWRGELREYLRQTHWLLPYPGPTLVSRDAKGRSRWWTNYNEIIDEFNQDAARADSNFQLDADIMKEWPTVRWDDRMQDFRQPAQVMQGELTLEKDLAEMSVPQFLEELNALDTISDGGGGAEDAEQQNTEEQDMEQQDTSHSDETTSDEFISEDELIIDENDIEGLHRSMVRRSERLQQVRNQVQPLQRALREFQKGFEVLNRGVADDVDVDDNQDEDYRPKRRDLRRIDVPDPLWRRQPEIAKLHRKRVRRIQRLLAQSRRLDRQMQVARGRWEAARAVRVRLARQEQRRKEQQSQELKERELRWIQDLQRQKRARREAAERERVEAARRDQEREQARREQEEQETKAVKRQALERHVQRFLQREQLKRDRAKNLQCLRDSRHAVAHWGKAEPPAYEGGGRMSKEVLRVLVVTCEMKEEEYRAQLAHLDPSADTDHHSGPSIRKYARDNRSIEEGDLEYSFGSRS